MPDNYYHIVARQPYMYTRYIVLRIDINNQACNRGRWFKLCEPTGAVWPRNYFQDYTNLKRTHIQAKRIRTGVSLRHCLCRRSREKLDCLFCNDGKSYSKQMIVDFTHIAKPSIVVTLRWSVYYFHRKISVW